MLRFDYQVYSSVRVSRSPGGQGQKTILKMFLGVLTLLGNSTEFELCFYPGGGVTVPFHTNLRASATAVEQTTTSACLVTSTADECLRGWCID